MSKKPKMTATVQIFEDGKSVWRYAGSITRWEEAFLEDRTKIYLENEYWKYWKEPVEPDKPTELLEEGRVLNHCECTEPEIPTGVPFITEERVREIIKEEMDARLKVSKDIQLEVLEQLSNINLQSAAQCLDPNCCGTAPVKKPTGRITERCGKKFKIEFQNDYHHKDLVDKVLILSAEGDARLEPWFNCTTASWYYIFSKENNPDLSEDLIIASGIGEPVNRLTPVENISSYNRICNFCGVKIKDGELHACGAVTPPDCSPDTCSPAGCPYTMCIKKDD